MRIVDDDGRLFGRVNVYDALVLLAVGGVLVGVGAVAAGDAFADGAAESERSVTRYVTVDLGERPSSVLERLPTDDAAVDEGATDDVTITDTYVGPADRRNVSVLVRVRVDGTVPAAGATFEYEGEPVEPGGEFDLATAASEIEGEILAVESEGRSLPTERTAVLVEADLSPTTATLVERNDTYRIAGRTVARVAELVVRPARSGGERTALLGLSLRTVRYSGSSYFGDTRVAAGETVPFRTDRYALSGVVRRVGEASPPGNVTTVTAVVKIEDVEPDVADGFERNAVDRRGGTTVAEIVGVRTDPASMVVTDADGEVHERDHPRKLDVYLTVELRVRRTAGGLRFRATPLREGSELLLDFRTIAAEGTVVDIDRG